MSIKIDPETQKAVDPESIGENDVKWALFAFFIVAVVVLSSKFYF